MICLHEQLVPKTDCIWFLLEAVTSLVHVSMQRLILTFQHSGCLWCYKSSFTLFNSACCKMNKTNTHPPTHTPNLPFFKNKTWLNIIYFKQKKYHQQTTTTKSLMKSVRCGEQVWWTGTAPPVKEKCHNCPGGGTVDSCLKPVFKL